MGRKSSTSWSSKEEILHPEEQEDGDQIISPSTVHKA
jgi:hypothetical protein